MTPLCPQTDRGVDAEFWTRFSDKLEALRVPFSGGIALTNRCNLRCTHCYAREDDPAGRELGAPRWKSILDELKEAGCLYLLFTGGDPLVREDFADIYAYARRNGFLVTLFSN
ncbi:MAG: radical SAM protein, partial [Candidatus Aminicenantes bacterium]|nr:radical SAM protein [Candidatus Aminicenantes bacterium]